MENKVYQYYKDLPPWAKGVVVVGGALVVYLVGSRLYRSVFPTETERKNRALEKNVDNEIVKLQNDGKKATFSDSNYNKHFVFQEFFIRNLFATHVNFTGTEEGINFLVEFPFNGFYS